jgi:hypothetical protein
MRDRIVVHRAPRTAPGFQEELYEHLKGTPWYLASAGIHGLAFAVFAALAGEAVAPPAARAAEVSWNPPPPEIDPEIQPVLDLSPPQDEPLDADPPVEIVEDVPETDIRPEESDPAEHVADDRLPPGPFEGDGSSAVIGTGGGGKGGGPPFSTRRLPALREKAKEVLPATEAGLDWLARHQSPDGRWDADGFEARCSGNRCGGAGGPLHDAGLTGLSLLAFLGYGETHRSPKYGHVVRAGLKYL